MRPLDARGRLAVAEFAFYLPVVAITIYLNFFRHGRDRQSRWFFLSIFLTRQYISSFHIGHLRIVVLWEFGGIELKLTTMCVFGKFVLRVRRCWFRLR